MGTFVVVGAIGVALLVLSIVLDDLVEGLFESLGVDGGSGWFSLPVLAAFASAFGLAGGVATAAGADLTVAAAAGAGAGILLAWLAVSLTHRLRDMATDEVPQTAQLVGRTAKVVTPVAAGRFGEVLVRQAGQPVKLAARSDDDVAAGGEVVIVAVTSPTSVVVEAAERFWGDRQLDPASDEEGSSS